MSKMAQSSDFVFCRFFPADSVSHIRATKESIPKDITTETPERRTELHDSTEVGKEEEGKIIEVEKTEDTENEKRLWERGNELVAELLKEEEMEEVRRKNKRAFLEKEAQRRYGDESELEEVDLKNRKNFMLASIEQFVQWLRKEPDESTYETIEEDIQRSINALRMIDLTLNKRGKANVNWITLKVRRAFQYP